ncbi:MAG TPA: hypothetical protein PK752_00675, partial [Accumulibacter sp.]|uniref:hypothetical protein n=1 Tax=Accumulibacter sp. TaxID=2053492 RepID=UPI002BDEE994
PELLLIHAQPATNLARIDAFNDLDGAHDSPFLLFVGAWQRAPRPPVVAAYHLDGMTHATL